MNCVACKDEGLRMSFGEILRSECVYLVEVKEVGTSLEKAAVVEGKPFVVAGVRARFVNVWLSTSGARSCCWWDGFYWQPLGGCC